MKFASKLTKEDVAEYRKLTRSSSQWLNFALYPIGLIFLILRGWRLSSVVLTRTPAEIPYIVFGWIAAVGLLAWTWINRRKQQDKVFEQTNSMRPDTITFTEAGLSCEGPAGASALIPWQRFNSWREGQRVFLLKMSGGKSYAILPVGQLSDLNRMPIRQFLQTHIAATGK